MAYKYKALKINGKRIDEHRYVMELHLGRKLLKGEVVRHKDKNTLNNAIENLYVVTRQQQYQEQLKDGELSKSVLDGLARKAQGIKKVRKRYQREYIPKVKKAKKEPDVFHKPKRVEKVFQTKVVDASKMIPLKIEKRTTIYIKEGTSQAEIDRIILKHSR